MEFRLLEPGDPRWTDALAHLRHDVYHLPDYARIEAVRIGGKPIAAYAERGAAKFLLPLILSEAQIGESLHVTDALSPYGYPCPLFSDAALADQGFVDDTLTALRAALADRGVAGLFVRLHPLLPSNHKALARQGAVVAHGETVWIDLSADESEILRQTQPRLRTAIRHLRTRGVQVTCDEHFTDYDAFIDLYYSTMARNSADAIYYFDHDYFESLRNALDEGLTLWFAKGPRGEILAGALLMARQGIVQYHLGCNDIEQPLQGAMKLLFDEVRQWAQRAGFRQLHLGGGRGAQNDSLFRFKATFSERRATFRTWRVICNTALYDEATKAWCRLSGEPSAGPGGYFPAYRQSVRTSPLAGDSDPPTD